MKSTRRPVGRADRTATGGGAAQRRVSLPPSGAQAPSDVIQGLRAGLAVFAVRRRDVLRIVHTPVVRGEIAELARWASAQGIACVETAESQVDRFAESTQHEGLCVEARPRKWESMQELADLLARSRGVAIALDRVRNPYNVGAILRSAAFFGLDAALLGAPAPHPGLAPTAVRVAEGGAEHLRLARTTDLADTLARLRTRGVRVVGADAHAVTDASALVLGRPAVIVLGNEREGLGDRIRAQCDALVAIRGGGLIESLNVAVAAGVLFSAVMREPRL
jgi:TrmH RNA methyltransferase